MFGRATIMLGICLHSSLCLFSVTQVTYMCPLTGRQRTAPNSTSRTRRKYAVVKLFLSLSFHFVSSLVTFQVHLGTQLPYTGCFVMSLFSAQFCFSALTLLVGWQEEHPACKKIGAWWGWARVSPHGVAPSRMVSVSASVNLPLHRKVQKFSSGTGSSGWSWKRGCKMVVVVVVVLLHFFDTVSWLTAPSPPVNII